MNFSKKLGLISRREQWVLTGKGWALLGIILISFMLGIFSNIYTFLSANEPLPKADILVVEGWLPDYGVKAAIAEFEHHGYQKVITTGAPVPIGFYLTEYKTFAEISAATFQALGFNPDKLVAVSCPEVIKDRTYYCAIALRNWLLNSNLEIKSMNLLSLGPHTRRSWLLFKKALEPAFKIGAIALPPQDYDPQTWWQYSEGVRSVLSETIAYIYVRFFWSP